MRLSQFILPAILISAILLPGCSEETPQTPIPSTKEELPALEQDKRLEERVRAYRASWGEVDTGFQEAENGFEVIPKADKELLQGEAAD